MTWYFDPSGTTFDLYDHTGTKVRKNVEFGGTWSGDFPRNAVFDEMYDVTQQSYADAGGVVDEYVLLVLAEALFEQIEEGTPP
jgi:hypothetical protein